MDKKGLFSLVGRLVNGEKMEFDDWLQLLSADDETMNLLACEARKSARLSFGTKIYLRGLVEITSYCKNNCFYCGLRCSNKNASRYRLSKERIMACCEHGAMLGFNTFVLQGGEDPGQDDAFITDIVSEIHARFPEKAITLSVGERSEEAYSAFRKAGATRYLLRHETASPSHYARLHPASMSLENRKHCLFVLKNLGYQVGSGMMVGSPFQTDENLAEDLLFLSSLQPHMIGIGPFVPATATPFESYPSGSVRKTLLLLSLLRLLFPKALIPSTTALATLIPNGMEQGILSGANVVMPNLSPVDVRGKYSIYNNKRVTGSESAAQLEALQARLSAIGYQVDFNRGDYPR